MKLGKLAEYYYTAAEARRILGVDESTFQYWGKDGRINRTYLPGRKQPVYAKNEVDNLAYQIEAAVIAHKAEEFEYRKATLEDIEEECSLAYLLFGRGTLQVPREAFLRKNPDVDYHLYDQGKLVAFINIFPLKHETMVRFMTGEIRGWEINPEDIEPFAPGKPLECLIMDAVTTPTVPPIKRMRYSSYLIAKFIKTLNDWGKQGVEIAKLYSVGNTPSGQRILKTAGFTVISEVAPDRIAFELDVMKSDAKVLETYKNNLKQWKEQHQSQSIH